MLKFYPRYFGYWRSFGTKNSLCRPHGIFNSQQMSNQWLSNICSLFEFFPEHSKYGLSSINGQRDIYKESCSVVHYFCQSLIAFLFGHLCKAFPVTFILILACSVVLG